MGFFIGLVFIVAVMASMYEKLTADEEEVTEYEKKISWSFWAGLLAFIIGLIGYFFFGWRF